MRTIENIVILTGAGISAESGIPTFRAQGTDLYWEYDLADGTRKKHRVED